MKRPVFAIALLVLGLASWRLVTRQARSSEFLGKCSTGWMSMGSVGSSSSAPHRHPTVTLRWDEKHASITEESSQSTRDLSREELNAWLAENEALDVMSREVGLASTERYVSIAWCDSPGGPLGEDRVWEVQSVPWLKTSPLAWPALIEEQRATSRAKRYFERLQDAAQ